MSPINSARPRRALVMATSTAFLAGVALVNTAPAQARPVAQDSPAPVAKSTGNFLKLWTAEWMAGQRSYSTAEAQALARRMTVIAAMRGKFTSHMAAMKQANPALKILVYRNATFGGKGMADSLYAKNKSGQRIYARKWPTTYLMNLANPAWGQEVARSCRELTAISKYDGCFLDVLGSGPLMGNYLSSLPVTSGKTWTHPQFINWTSAIARGVKSSTGRTTMGNGLGNGRRYFSSSQSSKPLATAADGMEPELFVREAHGSVNSYPSEATWKMDVDMMIDVQNKGNRVLALTKVWTTASESQKSAWHKYALGTFLLGSNGNSMFCFLRDKNSGASTMNHPYNLVNIGTPVGGYAKVGAAYTRTFTGGRVLVNPTKSSVSVPLAKRYSTIDGNAVAGSISLAPNTAAILRG